jgi:hypothetical protein
MTPDMRRGGRKVYWFIRSPYNFLCKPFQSSRDARTAASGQWQIILLIYLAFSLQHGTGEVAITVQHGCHFNYGLF